MGRIDRPVCSQRGSAGDISHASPGASTGTGQWVQALMGEGTRGQSDEWGMGGLCTEAISGVDHAWQMERPHKRNPFFWLSGLVRMGIGLDIGLKVFIAGFRADFNELLFVSIALSLVEAFVNFDHNGLLMSHEANLPWNLWPPCPAGCPIRITGPSTTVSILGIFP